MKIDSLVYTDDHIERTLRATLVAFREFISASYEAPDPVVAAYRKLRASYAVEIMYPDGGEATYSAKFGEWEAKFDAGPSDRHADAVLRISASALTAWATRAKTYSFLRAFMRKSSTLYVLDRAGDGTVALARSKVPDLLEHYLTRRAKGAELALKEHFDRELSPFTKNA